MEISNWLNPITIISVQSALIGGCVFYLKLYVDKQVEHKLDKNLESYKTMLKLLESDLIARRQSYISTTSESVSLIYEARNIIREVSKQPINAESISNASSKIEMINTSIERFLYKNRAILTDAVYKILHNQRRSLSDIHHHFEQIGLFSDTIAGFDMRQLADEVIQAYTALDEDYSRLLEIINPQQTTVEP